MKTIKPLEDIRILSIETYGAGPWGTMQLADLGAEVIKIEMPGTGDISRYVPPGAKDGDSLFFQSINRGKKSIVLDIRTPKGRDAFNRLLPAVDVLFANPKGTMPEKMGLTYEDLKEYNPKLVCCFLTGYGRKGPRKGHPGYDYLAQALSGIVWMGGEPDGPPARCGVSVIDWAAGTNAAFLMLAAVHQARQTGRGCTVDTSLLEVALAFGNYLNTWHLSTGWEPQKLPLGAHQSIVPSQLFQTADSWLMVMAQQDKFYVSLVNEIGLPDLATDPRFVQIKDRYENREVLLEVLSGHFKTRKTAKWVALLEGKVPIAPVNSIPEALRDPQLDALGSIVEYDHPVLGRVRQTGPPFQMENYTPDFKPGSSMGADTRQVLLDLGGLTPEEIDQLRKTKTIQAGAGRRGLKGYFGPSQNLPV
jgi:crotonobetainyl-CoA:carnitine CoA-transferase CaiB-like acyl-CoA transferase